MQTGGGVMASEQKLSTRVKLLIFIVAAAVRAGYVLVQYRFGLVGGDFVSGDSTYYIEIAKNIVAGKGLADAHGLTAYVSPGFPVFLAGCFGIFGEETIWASLFQCVLSALACVFIGSATAAMFGRRAGLLAGIIASFHYELVLWTSGQILTEPLYTFLLAAAVCALAAAAAGRAEEFANRKYALAGLLFGLAALVRPLALAVALGLGILMILVWLFYDRKKLKKPLIFIGVCLLVMQPWGLRNYFVLNHYQLASSEAGFVFWLGNNPEYDLYEHPDLIRFGGYTTMFKTPPELAQKLAGRAETEKDQIYARRAAEHIFNDPAAFFTRALHKTWNMWRPTFSGSSFQNKLISYTVYPFLLLLSLTGIYLAWRKESEEFTVRSFLLNLTGPFGLLSAFLLIHLALHAIINGEIRFRVPLWIALIPFAALSLATISDFLKSVRASQN